MKQEEKKNAKKGWEQFKRGTLHWAILALLGLILIFGHSLAQNIICKIIAVALILTAASGVYSWWKEKSKAPEALAALLGSALFCLFGLWILFNTDRFISLINIVLGAVVILISLLSLYRSWKLGMTPQLILSAVGLVLGIVIACYNAATSVPVILQGIGLVYTAIVGFLSEKRKKQ